MRYFGLNKYHQGFGFGKNSRSQALPTAVVENEDIVFDGQHLDVASRKRWRGERLPLPGAGGLRKKDGDEDKKSSDVSHDVWVTA
jgi:hypothetical protein